MLRQVEWEAQQGSMHDYTMISHQPPHGDIIHYLMVAYPSHVAFALLSFPDSAPHVAVCFGIRVLMSRGGRGARRVSLKRNWMARGVSVYSILVEFLNKVTHGEQ